MVTKSVSIKKVATPDGIRWRVRWCENGKDKSARHETKSEAESYAAELRTQKESRRDDWQSLSVYERSNLISAYSEAKRLGVDIHRAVLLASQSKPVTSKPIGTVIDELRLAKLNSGKSPKYVKILAIVLNQFVKGRETMDINRFTLKDVESFMDSKNLAYRQTLRGRLSTLFNFAVRRGYRMDNPCNRLEQIKVTAKPPAIFTIEQVKTSVEWLNKNAKHGLPWFVLSALCGLRPEEAEKTTKADIHFTEGFIRVEAQTTKVRQRRVVYPLPEAMELLESALKLGTLPLSSGERRWMLSGRPGKSKGLRDVLGFKVWPKDITRHTAASYWLASDGSAAHVSEMLGHSEKTLKKHYKALVTKKEAEEFWQTVKQLVRNT